MAKRKEKNPDISIIIPSYQKALYLKRTLDSIFNQKGASFEVIIQDGGSTDGSIEIIKEYANKHKNIIWESKKDKGQADALNKGFKKANGKIFGYINADDLFKKDAFRKLIDAHKKNPQAFWFCGLGDIIDDKDNQTSNLVTKYKNWLIKLNKRVGLLSVNYLTQPATFISRQAYQEFGPFDQIGRIVMEYGLWLRLSRKEMPVVIPDYLASFRLTTDNLSATAFNKILEEDFRLARKETRNVIVLGFHYLNNFARVALITLLHSQSQK